MKKKYLFIVLTSFALLTTACSTKNVVSPNDNKESIEKEVISSIDPLTTDKCIDVTLYEDGLYGSILVKEHDDGTLRTLLDGDKNEYNQIIDCGEDINKKLSYNTYYLIEALQRYNTNPEPLSYLLESGVNTNILDRNGNNPYSIALANGVYDQEILNKLSKDLSDKEISDAKTIVDLTLFGKNLSIDDLKSIKESGISLNSDMTDYSYLDYLDVSSYMTGTILGNTLVNKDYEKLKWLLENGVDPNQHFGVAEYEISPLRYTLMNNDLKSAELLLQNGSNPDEIFTSTPIESSLLVEYYKNINIKPLLEKYGAKVLFYSEEGVEYSKEDILEKHF